MQKFFNKSINAQKLYRAWAKNERDLPVWHQPWWLDLNCKDRWSAKFVKDESGNIMISLPFTTRSRFGFKIVTQPSLNQCLGPWFSNKVAILEDKQLQKDLIRDIVNQISWQDGYQQNWMPELTNLVELNPKHLERTVFHTYQLQLQDPSVNLWSGINSNMKRAIKKAQEQKKVFTRITHDIERIWKPLEDTFKRQGLTNPYDKKIMSAILEHGEFSSRSFGMVAIDCDDNTSASAIFISDERRTYYLAGGYSNPKSSDMSLLLWDSIKEAKKRGSTVFDFEGSMIPGIAYFFSSFGANQISYLKLQRFPFTMRGHLSVSL